MTDSIQFVSDSNGEIKSVIIPIELWKKINNEDETEYLLQSQKNRERLLESINRNSSMSKEEAFERIGI